VALGAFLVGASPRTQWLANAGIALAGLSSWSILGYALHRFVLRRMEPFRSWRTTAREIFAAQSLQRHLAFHCCPAVFLLTNAWRASAVILGVLTGYFAFAIMHHAIHH
jgi:hypothetical protein